jgi:hypothetical protein
MLISLYTLIIPFLKIYGDYGEVDAVSKISPYFIRVFRPFVLHHNLQKTNHLHHWELFGRAEALCPQPKNCTMPSRVGAVSGGYGAVFA